MENLYQFKRVIWKPLLLLSILLVFMVDQTLLANSVLSIATRSPNTSVSKSTVKVATKELAYAGKTTALYAYDCTPPGASASVSGTITCSSPTVTLSGSSPTTGVTYSWSGPGGFISGAQNPVIYMPGTYILTVTSPSGGCTSVDSVQVARDTVQPDANADVSGVINCSTHSVTLQATTSVPNATFWWIGPGSYTTSQQNPTVSTSGGYTLIVTNPANGCASTATTYVEKNVTLPLASAYVSGTLTCVTDSVQLTSSSPTSGVEFSWTGPGDFISAFQNTKASQQGTYTVTVTNPVNACVSTASVNVVQNTTPPEANITPSATELTCTTINATLYGSSPTVGVTYDWSGPNGFSTDVQNPVVATAGSYVLEITRVSNGCVSTDTFELAQNKVRPGAIATPSDQLNCANSSITLQGTASSQNVNYRWMGPSGFGISYEQDPLTSYRGGYILTTTDINNGCQSQAIAIVVENKTLPSSVTALNSGPLTCSSTSIDITGNSTTSGATYSWSGPDNYTSAGKVASVTAPGTYTLTVKHPVSFCTVVTNTTVAQNITPPSTVTAETSGPLTCSALTTTVTGSSATNGVIYSWSGPDNFTSTVQNPLVEDPGTYHLTVTNPANGCKDSTTTVVAQDLTPPASISADNSGPLTCSLTSVSVTGSSATEGVAYNWSGPGNFASTAQNPSVSTAGTYKVVITNTMTGCKDSTTTLVTEDITLPGVNASVTGTLTCDVRSVTMSASSSTPGVIYTWTGPENFNSTEQYPATNHPGDYTVTALNPANNCASSFDVTVTQDTLAPENVTASAQDILTCALTSVGLTGSSGTAEVNYSWTGPNGFVSSDQNPSVNAPGNYVLTVTNNLNGCTADANVPVIQNNTPPADVTATRSGILNCVNDTVTLTGASSTDGVTYSWSGPGVSSSDSTAPATVVGTYYLTVTDPSNGCYETRSVLVTKDVTVPANVNTSVSGALTCSTNEVTVSATSGTSGVEYSWSGPDDFTSNLQAPSVGQPGDYTVTVTYPVSGCAVPKTLTVTQNIDPPADVTATASGVLTCNNTSVNLSGSSSTAATYNWNGPDGYMSALQNPIINAGGKYILTVIGSANGCTAKDSVTVTENFAPPTGVTASVSGPLDCNNTFAILNGTSTTDGAGFEWTGPGNFNSPDPMTFTNAPGNYFLTVTNPLNGCTAKDSVIVVDNSAPPVCNLSVPDGSTVEELTNNTISTDYSSSYTYAWTVSNWNIISGEDTYALTYQAGSAGTTADISLHVIDNTNGCSNDCGVTLSAVAPTLKSTAAGISGQLSGGTKSIVEELVMNVYPLPSNGKVSMDFVSPVQTDALVTVYNASGNVITTLYNGSVEANQPYHLEFNQKEDLPSGIYFCVLRTETKTISEKIIIE